MGVSVGMEDWWVCLCRRSKFLMEPYHSHLDRCSMCLLHVTMCSEVDACLMRAVLCAHPFGCIGVSPKLFSFLRQVFGVVALVSAPQPACTFFLFSL